MKKISDEVSLKGKLETITIMEMRKRPGEALVMQIGTKGEISYSMER